VSTGCDQGAEIDRTADKATRYAMLITSLPFHGPLFGARHTPLSRLRLEQRLRVLDPADDRCLRRLTEILDFIHHSMTLTDADLVRRTRALEAELPSEMLRGLLRFRMEMRTLLAAQRRRRRGETAPPREPGWGYGRWVGQIERNWLEPGFRLERVFPWVGEAERLLRSDDSLGLERLKLAVTWAHLDRMAEGHWFDFEAVVIYVLRWDLIARWTGQDGEAALARFDDLTVAGLGHQADLFGVEGPTSSDARTANPKTA
jgi:hypothetical protein